MNNSKVVLTQKGLSIWNRERYLPLYSTLSLNWRKLYLNSDLMPCRNCELAFWPLWPRFRVNNKVIIGPNYMHILGVTIAREVLMMDRSMEYIFVPQWAIYLCQSLIDMSQWTSCSTCLLTNDNKQRLVCCSAVNTCELSLYIWNDNSQS